MHPARHKGQHGHIMAARALLVLLSSLALCSESRVVTFRNTGWPLADSHGQLMDGACYERGRQADKCCTMIPSER